MTKSKTKTNVQKRRIWSSDGFPIAGNDEDDDADDVDYDDAAGEDRFWQIEVAGESLPEYPVADKLQDGVKNTNDAVGDADADGDGHS